MVRRCLMTVAVSLSGTKSFSRYTPTANVLWVVAGVIFVVSIALLTAGNVLASHQSAHWWSAVVYADLGGLGTFLSAVVAIAALRISRKSTDSPSNSDSSSNNRLSQ